MRFSAVDLFRVAQRATTESVVRDLIGRVLERRSYPGQRYRHGWIPVTVATAKDDERAQRIRELEQHIEKLRREGPPPYQRDPERYVTDANARFFAADGLRVGDRIPKRPERLGYESLPSGHWRDPATGRLHGENATVGWTDDILAAEEYLANLKDPSWYKETGEEADAAIRDLNQAAGRIRRRSTPSHHGDGERVRRSRVGRNRATEGRPYPGQRYRHGWIPVAASIPNAKAYSDADLEETYGEVYDEVEFAPGMHLQIGTGDEDGMGMMTIVVSAPEPGRFYLLADMDQADSVYEFLSNGLSWAAWRDLDELGHRPPDPQNGLIDWREDDGAIIGFDADGDVHIGWPAGTGLTADGKISDEVAVVDLTRDEAQELYRSLERFNSYAVEDE